MMDEHEKLLFDELQAEVKCPKNCSCLFAAVENLCEGKYHADLDLMECLRCDQQCSFCTKTPQICICNCPLRKFIAKNFDKWTVASTARLRLRMQGSQPQPGQ